MMTEQAYEDTYAVAKGWFDALTHGQFDTALGLLDPEVEWINYTVVPGMNDVMPWIGTYHGPQQVLETLQIFTGLVSVQREELVRLVVQGDEAAGVIHEQSVVKANGQPFEIEFIQWLTIRNGKIVRWKSYTDPSPIIVALRGA